MKRSNESVFYDDRPLKKQKISRKRDRENDIDENTENKKIKLCNYDDEFVKNMNNYIKYKREISIYT